MGMAEDADATGAAPSQSTEAPAPPDIHAFLAKVEARMGDMGRQLAALKEGRKAPSKQDEAAKPEAAQGGLTAEDLSAAITYGRVSAGLPPAAQKQLQEMQEQGASFRDLARYAEFAASMAGEQPPAPKDKPPAHGGTPGASNPARPATVRELMQLRSTDEKAFDRLMKQPDFDASSLPM